MSRSLSRAVVSAAAFAAMTVTVAVSGAPAYADVTAVSVAVGPDGLLTGCRYQVTATVTDSEIPPGSVFFMLAGGVIPGNGERIPGEAVHHPENNTVTTTWTPTRIGPQNLIAIQSIPGQYTSQAYIPVEVVGTGFDTGSSCPRLG
ncbi:hypothetical protein [Nocardia iowensis]|uniref:Uncharacterized protein n=1 Tax=Nocardia iowensis TaxID=204891 RepID=A0ABX8RQB3_NOCIO|nr:hypothetical protein [Nocardia iowensis]QXN91825.1 hypothetical protein KV110_01100 [Nocardia iowensis]